MLNYIMTNDTINFFNYLLGCIQPFNILLEVCVAEKKLDTSNLVFFDPLGQFEVLNFYTIYLNIFEKFTKILPETFVLQAVLYNTKQSLSFFTLISELSQAIHFLNFDDFFTNEL